MPFFTKRHIQHAGGVIQKTPEWLSDWEKQNSSFNYLATIPNGVCGGNQAQSLTSLTPSLQPSTTVQLRGRFSTTGSGRLVRIEEQNKKLSYPEWKPFPECSGCTPVYSLTRQHKPYHQENTGVASGNLWKSRSDLAKVQTWTQQNISWEIWKWLCANTYHPTRLSLNDSPKKNGYIHFKSVIWKHVSSLVRTTFIIFIICKNRLSVLLR